MVACELMGHHFADIQQMDVQRRAECTKMALDKSSERKSLLAGRERGFVETIHTQRRALTHAVFMRLLYA